MTTEQQASLIKHLCLQLRNNAMEVRIIETHISYILLTGEFAYKIRKDVKFYFLDFSSLARRRFDCEEELRLNRRYSPDLYLEVVAICGDPSSPIFAAINDEDLPVLEYAVKMREFPQERLASRMLKKGELTISHIDALAKYVAKFHNECAVAPADTLYVNAENILEWARKSISIIRPMLEEFADINEINGIAQWVESEYHARFPAIQRRKSEGYVRECHGDLYLGNIVILDDKPQLFDCIEFNDDLRWIDVINDIAFPTMDLHVQGRSDFAYRFLNDYFETSGDYSGLCLLRFYMLYRTLVRAEVALLRGKNEDDHLSLEAYSIYRAYLDFAVKCAMPSTPFMIMMHGLSGSGKTSFSGLLMESIGAIRVRSDVERKRVFNEHSTLYSRHTINSNYQRLIAAAHAVLDAGLGVIVDATFSQRAQRDLFAEYARQRKIPFIFVSLTASVEEMRNRLTTRKQQGTDASDADFKVLERQLREQEPIGLDELDHVIAIDSTGDLNRAQEQISSFLHNLTSCN